MAGDDKVIGAVSVAVTPDARGFHDKLASQTEPDAKSIGDRIGQIIAEEINRQVKEKTRNLPVGGGDAPARESGTRTAGAFADAFKKKIDEALRALPPIQIGVAATEAEQKLKDLKAELLELSGKRVGVDLTDAEAIAKLDELKTRLEEINRSSESVQVKTDTAAAIAKLDEFKAKLDTLHDKDVSVNANTGGAKSGLDDVKNSADQSGNSVLAMAGRFTAISAAAFAAAEVAIPALLAIGAAAGAALAAAGVGFLGFSGIPAAIQAANNPSATAGGQQAQGANQLAGLGIQTQLQQIQQANATQSAQDQLTQALQAQRQAEQQLHDARITALRDLQNLQNQVADNALSQQQASIDLIKAKQILALDLNAPGASQAQYQLQIQQDRLNVAVAQQRQKDLSTQGGQLRTSLATAQQQGVNGNPNVVSAQYALIDANRKLAEAQANVATVAQQNTLQQQQLAIQARGVALGMATAAAGANQFAQAMNQLNPIQQQFVQFYLSTMKPVLAEFKTAASGFLPGLEQGFKNLAPAFGPITNLISQIAKSMGSVFIEIAKSLSSPAGQQFINFLAVELPKAVIASGSFFIGLGKTIAEVFQAAAPLLSAFTKAFSDAFSPKGGAGLSSFFNTLIPAMQPFAQLLRDIGRVLGDTLVALAPAMGPLLTALDQVVNVLGPPLTTFLTAFAQMLAQIAGPVLVPLAKAIAEVLKVITPWIPALTTLIQNLAPLGPLILGVVTAIKLMSIAQAALNLVLDANPIALIITGLAALGAAFYEAYKHSETFRDIVKGVFDVISEVALFLWHNVLEPSFEFWKIQFKIVADTVLFAWNDILKPVYGYIRDGIKSIGDVIGSLGTVWSDVWAGIKTVIGDAWAFIQKIVGDIKGIWSGIWDGLKSGFDTVWSGLKTALNDAIIGFEDFVNAVVQGITTAAHYASDAWSWIPGLGGTNIPIVKNAINLPLIGAGGGTPDGTNGSALSGSAPHGHRAAGGPVLAGHTYRVNEVGPEMFVPKVDGYILDNLTTQKAMRGNGGRSLTQNIQVFGQSDPTATAHQVLTRAAARRD